MTNDTSNFDIQEQIDILIKSAFGLPSTSDKKQWYDETNIKFNNYLFGDELFLDKIPGIDLDFDNGVSVDASALGLDASDFINYNTTSIVDDSTGTVRRYQNIILEECPGLGDYAGDSWYKLDNLGRNVLTDTIQFNYNQDLITGAQPYAYRLSTENAANTSDPKIPFGVDGGNWFFDVKSGIVLFLDSSNLSQGNQIYNITRKDNSDNFINRPVLTFYKYVGRKGILNLDEKIQNLQDTLENLDLSNINIDIDISNIDISNLIVNQFNNKFEDLSSSIDELQTNFVTENLFIKSDINLSKSNIEYNRVKIELIENDLTYLNNRCDKLYIDISNNNNLDISFTNLVYIDSDVLTNLYRENTLLKSDIILSENNVNYYKAKIGVFDNVIENINNSINNLVYKSKNYNIYNLLLFYKQQIISETNVVSKCNLDYQLTYKNGYYDNIFFDNNYNITFNKLENLLNNNDKIFIEFYLMFSIDISNNNNNNNNNNIIFDLSCISEYNYGLKKINIANIINQNLNINNSNFSFGPYIFKISNNLLHNQSIYYKNKFVLITLSDQLCKINNIKLEVKVFNYK